MSAKTMQAPQYLHVTKATKLQKIINCASLQFGEIISNRVAKKLKTSPFRPRY